MKKSSKSRKHKEIHRVDMVNVRSTVFMLFALVIALILSLPSFAKDFNIQNGTTVLLNVSGTTGNVSSEAICE